MIISANMIVEYFLIYYVIGYFLLLSAEYLFGTTDVVMGDLFVYLLLALVWPIFIIIAFVIGTKDFVVFHRKPK